MWSFLFGIAVGIATAVAVQSNLRSRPDVDERLAELGDRVEAMLQRGQELLTETRAEVEALRQRLRRGGAVSSEEAPAGSEHTAP